MWILVLFIICVHTGTCFSCNPGYYYSDYYDRCVNCRNNCETCSSSLSCDTCNVGHYGNSCGLTCSQACRDEECDKSDGWCACIDSYYGYAYYRWSSYRYACDPCPDLCLTCTSSLECTKCEVGYFGSVCDQPCGNCRNNKCSIDGQCTDGCTDGYYFQPTGCASCSVKCLTCTSSTECTSCNAGYFGKTCDDKCLNCKYDTCVFEDGLCLNGCKDGYYEETTECKLCRGNCSICRSDTECGECLPGYHGYTCQQQCPQNCGTCKNDTYCVLCNHGFYGQTCETECSSLCKNGCSKETGGCNGCIDAYYEEGGHCNECPGGCELCENIDECIRCQNGFFSQQNTTDCNACGDNCFTCKCKKSCTKCNEGYANVNGSCLSCHNCSDSTACLSRNVCYQCIDGFFGSYCGGKCKETCIRCDKLTGECTECKGNTFGLFCEQKCSSHCLQSLDNNSTCWKQNGTCTDGCEKEFSGPYCIAEISSATSPQVAMIVGSTSGVVALVIVVIVVVILMYRMRVMQQDSKAKGGKPEGSRGPRAANEVVNQAYDDMDTYPTTVAGHQSNQYDVVMGSADHVYAVLQEASPQKPAQPNKAQGHDVNNVETDNVYDVTSGGNGPGMQADSKICQDKGDTYSHISHASRARQLHHVDEDEYDHVTRHNPQKDGDNDTYDVKSVLHGYNYHVQESSKHSADEYSTVRRVQ